MKFGKEWYMKFHKDCCDRMVEITAAKNADYTGSGDDPFKNFKGVGLYDDNWVAVGFITRMSDKMSRIASFIQKGVLAVATESIEDTLLDLANYCILFAGYLRARREDFEIEVKMEYGAKEGRPSPLPVSGPSL